MTYDSKPAANAISGGMSGAAEAALTVGQMQDWFPSYLREERDREANVRLEERRNERTRIARELHDKLLQGFFGASMLVQIAADQMPANSLTRSSLGRVLKMMNRAIEEGRVAIDRLRSPELALTLERALADFTSELELPGVEFRILVTGRSKALRSKIQEQIYLIAKEAVANAFRHSKATSIEAEIEYLPGKLRLVVRDNGIGIAPKVLETGCDAGLGLQEMRARATSIGARFRVWSRPGAGTEVEVSVPGNLAEVHVYSKAA